MAVSVSRSIRTLPILVAAKTRSRGTGAGGPASGERHEEDHWNAAHQLPPLLPLCLTTLTEPLRPPTFPPGSASTWRREIHAVRRLA